MTENEDVKLNAINEEDLLDKDAKNKGVNNIIVYVLFGVTIFLIIGGVIFLFISLRVSDETKKNAELVTKFFKDGYEYKNYEKVMTYLDENYLDHSPAGAKGNAAAVNILKIVPNFFTDVSVDILDLT